MSETTVPNIESESKPKEKAPAFQFYPKDFLTDGKVLCMSNELIGMYIRLLCIDWLEDGFYEDDILRLTHFDWLDHDGVIRGDSDDVKAHLASCFVPHPNKPGQITNARLLKERQKQAERRIERVAAGRKGGKSKTSKQLKPQAELEISLSKTEAKSSSSSPSSSSSSIPISSSISVSNSITEREEDAPTFPKNLNTPEIRTTVERWQRYCKKHLKKGYDAISIEALLLRYADRPKELERDLNSAIINGWRTVRDASDLEAKPLKSYLPQPRFEKYEADHPMKGVKEFKATPIEIESPEVKAKNMELLRKFTQGVKEIT